MKTSKQTYVKSIQQILIVFGLVMIHHFVTAQEIVIILNGGIAGSSFHLPNSYNNPTFGEGLGIYFSDHFKNKKQWGIISGINMQYFANKAGLNDNAVFKTLLVDDFGTAFEYQESAKNYHEQQKFWAFTIPILISYEQDKSSNANWYINNGFKLLIPYSLQTKSSADNINLYGYYPDVNALITNLPQHGFGTLNNWSGQDKLSILKTSVLFSIESGLKFSINHKYNLYTGVYMDYGLTDITKPNVDGTFVSYSSTNVNNAKVNSLLAVNSYSYNKIISFGVNVKIGWIKKSTGK
jgi:hypothetical protein